jgi:hypothetical protein
MLSAERWRGSSDWNDVLLGKEPRGSSRDEWLAANRESIAFQNTLRGQRPRVLGEFVFGAEYYHTAMVTARIAASSTARAC